MLPKIDLPKYNHILHSGKKIEYRPFTVKEQKILLLAKEEKTADAQVDSILQVLDLCTYGKVDIKDLPYFDVEDLFIRIRSKSVGENIEISYIVKDDDGKQTKERITINIPISDIKVVIGEEHTDQIKINDSYSMKMKYPTLDMIKEANMNDIDMIKNCIDFIYDDENVYYFKDSTPEEVDEFVDSLDSQVLLRIRKFFDTMPKLKYETEVELKDGTKEKLAYEGLSDFFA